MDYDGVGERIRAVRTDRDLSQRELADATERAGHRVSDTSIGNYEKGSPPQGKDPTWKPLLAICYALRVNPSWVLTGRGVREWTPDADIVEEQRLFARRLRGLADWIDETAGKANPIAAVVSGGEMPPKDERTAEEGESRDLGEPRREEAG